MHFDVGALQTGLTHQEVKTLSLAELQRRCAASSRSLLWIKDNAKVYHCRYIIVDVEASAQTIESAWLCQSLHFSCMYNIITDIFRYIETVARHSLCESRCTLCEFTAHGNVQHSHARLRSVGVSYDHCLERRELEDQQRTRFAVYAVYNLRINSAGAVTVSLFATWRWTHGRFTYVLDRCGIFAWKP